MSKAKSMKISNTSIGNGSSFQTPAQDEADLDSALETTDPIRSRLMVVIATTVKERSAARRFWILLQNVVASAKYMPFVVCLVTEKFKAEVFGQYLAHDVHFLRAFTSEEVGSTPRPPPEPPPRLSHVQGQTPDKPQHIPIHFIEQLELSSPSKPPWKKLRKWKISAEAYYQAVGRHRKGWTRFQQNGLTLPSNATNRWRAHRTHTMNNILQNGITVTNRESKLVSSNGEQQEPQEEGFIHTTTREEESDDRATHIFFLPRSRDDIVFKVGGLIHNCGGMLVASPYNHRRLSLQSPLPSFPNFALKNIAFAEKRRQMRWGK